MFCNVISQKLQLHIGLYSSFTINLTAGVICQKIFSKYHDLYPYSHRKISWTNRIFQDICHLIDKPHRGIMAMMDEACLNVGNTTDKQLLDAMDSQLAQSKYYSSKKKDATKNKVVCKI